MTVASATLSAAAERSLLLGRPSRIHHRQAACEEAVQGEMTGEIIADENG